MLLKTRIILQRALYFTVIVLPLLQRAQCGGVGAAETLAPEERVTEDTNAVTDKPSSAPNSLATTTCAADYWPRQQDTMHSYVDETVWPCEDFHGYACGNWRAPYQLRARGARDTLTAVKADNKQKLMTYLLERQELQRNGTGITLRRSEDTAIRFFSACLERVTGEESGRVHLNVEADILRTYTNELRRISDWPILNSYWQTDARNDTLTWGTYLSAELRRYGVQALWRLLVTTNWQQAEQQIFYISAPSFDLLKPTRQAVHYDDDSEYVYKRYVKYLMLDLGVRVRRAQAIAAEVVGFEKLLFELVPSERLLLLREPQSLAALQAELPDLNLRKYFQLVLRDIELELPADYEQRLLIVADVPYLRKLCALLKRTKPDLLAKYLIVQFLAHFEVRLHDEESYQEQRDHCLQQLHSFLPAELTEIFIRLQHDDGVDMALNQSVLSGIFSDLKLQFERMLNATNVFERDALTKVLGLEKLRAMRLLLPKVSTLNSKDHLPPTIQLDKNNYDANLIKLWHWRTRQQFDEILETLQTGRSTASAYNNYGPLDVNAYYRLKQNVIELPVGILRAPFFQRCLDRAKIYGSFVYIIAHELMHGFDYDGLNYDKSGNVAGNWGAKAIIRFGSKSSCYLNERYEDGELKVNENIADTEGLRLALETYKRAGGENATLTNEQLKLFFLSFAQTWCGAGATESNSLHDGHSVRVNNVVGNFEEFAKAYRCVAHSEMNPKHKCSIW